MDRRQRGLIPQANDFQIATSWVPMTPGNPGVSQIYGNMQQDQQNWLDLGSVSQGQGPSQVNQMGLTSFLQEPEARHVAASCGSTNSATAMTTGYFDTWEAALGTNNVSFGDLLELAHVAGSTAAAETAYAQVTMPLANSSFNSRVSHQDADVSTVCSKFPFDLNSPAGMTDEVASSNNALQFEPITPDLTKNKGQVRQIESSQDTLKRRVEANNYQQKEQSRQVLNISESQENNKLDRAYEPDAEQYNTPPQKQRRKKHRPKVIVEGQPKRTPKPRTPKQHNSRNEPPATPSDKVNNTNTTSHENELAGSEKTPGARRKYVRRSQVDKPAPNPAEGGIIDPPTVSRPKRSCRRSLNFDIESILSDEYDSYWPSTVEDLPVNQSHSSVQLGKSIGATIGRTELGAAYDSTGPMNQVLKTHLADRETQYADPSTLKKTGLNCDTFNMSSPRGKCKIFFSDETHDKQESILEMTPKSLNSSNCSSSSACLTQETAEGTLKRRHSFRTDEAELYRNIRGAYLNSIQAYQAILPAIEPYTHSTQGMHFPAIYKKKRTEKGQPSATSYTRPFTWETNYTSLSSCNVGLSQASTSANDGAYSRMQNPRPEPAFAAAEKLRRKRSKGISKVRDIASLLEICKHFPTAPVKEAMISEFGERYENSEQPNACMEALVANGHGVMTTKKRSKRGILVSSTAPQMYARQQFTTDARGSLPAITWRGMSPVDEIAELAERLQYLDLNRESIHDQDQIVEISFQNKFQAENALVIYQRDGSIVPFTGSLVRKRKPRPKVDLDDETTRVWKLLLQDINSEGIDGTDEDKARWWEEERGVFHGRVDSFVARMRLVQGDRRFSPWKGSVVDSVVGVFLTQNVSDHLSSSAFMSLAAHFPLNPKTGNGKQEKGTMIIIEEPEVSAPDTDDTHGWHDDQSTQEIPGPDFLRISSVESNDERAAAHSGESSENSTNCTISAENSISQQPGSSRESSCVYHESTSAVANAATSFSGDQLELPEDMLSSQNSSVSAQNSVNFPVIQTSESASFLKLLEIAGTSELHGVQDQESENILPKIDVTDQLKHVACCSHLEKNEENHKGSVENVCPCSYSGLCLTPNSGAQETKCNDNESAKFLDLFRELSAPEQSKVSAESATQALNEEMRSETYISLDSHQNKAGTTTIDFRQQIQIEESNCNMQRTAEATTFSEVIVDVREEVSVVADSSKSEHTALSNKKVQHGGTLDRVNDTPKAKKQRPGKEKQNVDWDRLRLEAQINGKQREKTPNTMDSLDWDAVRCADVKEIADTIRERGMNNMLAERIKDFLNRIFREHGGIDLEWLRDVPPDKAKEYLLSIRGLGLKSVECVRLLTLHHLAFPVDTNVGRIAVRLGWVPLQPLPESLQLHLLELYPVLESIQKYLWPRLCKLDQRTLYELHYHMITFGKVFCTKSKPNCNACPLRGECRHFASAFASARLALPAPEEKSIVSATTENKAAGQNPIPNFSQLPLPLPPANQTQVQHLKLIDSAPIIEMPATPGPIVEEPASPVPEPEPILEIDIEDACSEDPNEIPTIKLNMEEFTQNVKKFVENNMELQEVEMSNALVALTPEAASIPTPKLKHISRLRTEHQVYELPDDHLLLKGFDKREPDDPCSYLLAIWTPGETADSIQPPGRQCNSQETGTLCSDETCFACNSIREARSQTVRGTLLIPCRTAMRGSFPLNGTYFQVNEVFADHDSSISPIDVPRDWLWNLPRRTVYFGTSVPSIFKGLTTESIQHCFWRGFVCVRGFDKKSRAPKPLMARLHFPVSKTRSRGKADED